MSATRRFRTKSEPSANEFRVSADLEQGKSCLIRPRSAWVQLREFWICIRTFSFRIINEFIHKECWKGRGCIGMGEVQLDLLQVLRVSRVPGRCLCAVYCFLWVVLVRKYWHILRDLGVYVTVLPYYWLKVHVLILSFQVLRNLCELEWQLWLLYCWKLNHLEFQAVLRYMGRYSVDFKRLWVWIWMCNLQAVCFLYLMRGILLPFPTTNLQCIELLRILLNIPWLHYIILDSWLELRFCARNQ